MHTFEVTTDIQTTIERCFDLARDIGFHVRSLEHTNERAVGGRTNGLIELDESVTWEVKHLGLNRRMTVKITTMERPSHFRDEQTDGPFKRFMHDHYFNAVGDGVTRMRDVIAFESPFGVVGRVADRLCLSGYLRRLIGARGRALKRALEPRGQSS